MEKFIRSRGGEIINFDPSKVIEAVRRLFWQNTER